MIERLLEILWWVLAPIIAVIGAAVGAWAIRRATRAWLEVRHAGAAAPVWFMSATILCLACAIAAIWATRTSSHWVDPFVLTALARLLFDGVHPFRDLSFPYSAFWLAGALIVVTIVYSVAALLIAWALGPPPAKDPPTDRPQGRRRGLPPASSAASAYLPKMGLLTALDSAASTGVVQWLYANLGYWDDPRPGTEPRFRVWVEPLHRFLSWFKWLSLPVASLGVTSALVWIAAALIHDAIGQILALPMISTADEEESEEEPEEEPEEDPELAESELIARLSQELGGTGLCLRPLGGSSSREADRASQRWPAEALGPLWESVLDQWTAPKRGGGRKASGGWWPWTHQLEAATHILSGKDLLLQSPSGTGRSTICDLLAAQDALCHAGCVLIIVPDEDIAAERVATLRQMGRAGGWHWIIGVHDLASDGISGLDPLVEQPEIVVGTVDALERHFMAVAGHWDVFLATLSLIVIHNVDRHGGARAASLGALCRRLLLLAQDLGAKPTVLTTASGLWQETTRLAEEVSSRALTVIAESAVGAPAPSQATYIAAGREGLVATLTERIEDAGWHCRIRGTEPSGIGSRTSTGSASAESRDGPGPHPRLALVSPVSAGELAAAGDQLAYLPSDTMAKDRVVVFRVHQQDHPLTTSLLAAEHTGTTLPGWITSKPTIPNGWGNPAAAAQALHRALSERESSREELEEHHDASATDHELSILAEKGWLVERSSAAPDPASGLPLPQVRYRLSDPAKVRIESASTVATSDPFHLLESSTKERLFSVDRVRADVALHPGFVFARRGRRYRIRRDSGAKIAAEPETEQIWTLPVRRLEIELDEWAPQRLRLGSDRELAAGRGPVTLRIEVRGVRRFGPDGKLLDEHLYSESLRAAYPARAAILRFKASGEGGPSGGAVHALAHLLRASLPLVLRAGPLDVDVTALEPDAEGRPGVALIDLHPFGAGYTEPMRTGMVRHWLEASLSMIGAGNLGECASPIGRWDAVDPDAAKDLLESLVGSN